MIRIYFLPFIAILVSIIFILRLVNLQIIDSSYKFLSDNNAVFEQTLFPERGLIFDRNEEFLVDNQLKLNLNLSQQANRQTSNPLLLHQEQLLSNLY